MRPNFWSRQSCFLVWNWFFEYEHPFVNKQVAITEPAVISARLLRLVSNGIVSTCKACSTFSNLNSSSKEMKGYAGRVGKHSKRRHWQPNELWVSFCLVYNQLSPGFLVIKDTPIIRADSFWIPGENYRYLTKTKCPAVMDSRLRDRSLFIAGGEALVQTRWNLADPDFECYFAEVIPPNNSWWLSRFPRPMMSLCPSKFEWSPLWILPKFSVIPPFGFTVMIPPFVLLNIKW